MNKKKYEKNVHDEHHQKHLLRYINSTSKALYEYWDQKMLSLLGETKNDVVLDYGCGIGSITNKISAKLAVGIDISKNLINKAKEDSRNCNNSFVVCDGERLPFKDHVFDKAIGRGILHHLIEPVKGLSEVQRAMKARGKMVFSEPNDSNPIIGLIRIALKSRSAGYSKEQIYFTKNYIDALFGNPRVFYFGYFAYPFGFPDITKVSVPRIIIKFLTLVDEALSRIPLIRGASWHIIIEKDLRC